MEFTEFDCGPEQMIVVYKVEDTGEEVDPDAAFSWIASDAAARSGQGWRIVSTAVVPTRHSGVAFGKDGSGYQTKASIAVVYGK